MYVCVWVDKSFFLFFFSKFSKPFQRKKLTEDHVMSTTKISQFFQLIQAAPPLTGAGLNDLP